MVVVRDEVVACNEVDKLDKLDVSVDDTVTFHALVVANAVIVVIAVVDVDVEEGAATRW